jgi:uncharacterized membrane protein
MPANEDSLTAAPVTEDRTVAMVAYLTFIGLIVAIVMHNSNKTRLASFHLRQSLGLMLTAIIYWPINFILLFVPILGWLITLVVLVSLLVLWVMGLMGALQGTMKPVPVVGPLYQRLFANVFN